jgi:hypothetical protein
MLIFWNETSNKIVGEMGKIPSLVENTGFEKIATRLKRT